MPKFDSIDHVNFEAVAALIDGELAPSAVQRARAHLEQCPDCREEVKRQQTAQEAVRTHNSDTCLRAPQSLVERLNHIADHPDAAATSKAGGRSSSSSLGSLSSLKDRFL